MEEIAWDRVPHQFPVQYQRYSIASALASKLVYKEGIHLVEAQPELKLAENSIMYYREDVKINKLVSDLKKILMIDSDMSATTGSSTSTGSSILKDEEKEKIIQLIKRGGARAALDIF